MQFCGGVTHAGEMASSVIEGAVIHHVRDHPEDDPAKTETLIGLVLLISEVTGDVVTPGSFACQLDYDKHTISFVCEVKDPCSLLMMDTLHSDAEKAYARRRHAHRQGL